MGEPKKPAAEQSLGRTKSEIDAMINMRTGSELLLAALKRAHARILHNLVRKNGMGDGSNA